MYLHTGESNEHTKYGTQLYSSEYILSSLKQLEKPLTIYSQTTVI